MSFGDELRDAREKAGLSVDDIMHVTKMTRDQVTGLETADYHAFSAPVYTKGFIKQYARAVGLDPVPLVKEYLANPNGTERNDPSREMPIVALETISAESGALVSVRPKVPHVAPAPAPAPVEKKVAAAPVPAPEKAVAAAPAPAAAPASPAPATEPEKTLLDFMVAPAAEAPAPAPKPAAAAPAPTPAAPAPTPAAPAPIPEKRLAPIAPGVVPPEPVSKLVRFDDPAPKPAPAPIEKEQPEPSAVGSAAAYWNQVAPPVAPKPVAIPATPFVFPGAVVAPKPAPAPAPTVAAPAPAPVPAPAPAPAPAQAPRPSPAPVVAPAPAPVPHPAPAPFPEKKVSAERDPLVAAAARPPVLSSAVAPSFVADDLFGTPERTPPPPVEPEKPAPPAGPTLFPDDDLAAAPDGPGAFQRFVAACGAAFRRFGSALRRIGARIGAAFKARWVRPALLGVAGVAILAALVALVAALIPAGGEEDPAAVADEPAAVAVTDEPKPVGGEALPPPPEPEIPEGPVEIVPVLPAPRSFAK